VEQEKTLLNPLWFYFTCLQDYDRCSTLKYRELFVFSIVFEKLITWPELVAYVCPVVKKRQLERVTVP